MKVNMKSAIKELDCAIARYENQRKTQLEFIQSDDFRNSVMNPDETVPFVTKHTNIIYDDYIGELKKAVDVLKRVGNSRRKKYIRKRKG